MFGIECHIILIFCLLAQWKGLVSCHGRLWEPPSRSTMWRRGFHTPINYQDMELFCGGFWHQVSLGYKCGLCGDPYDQPQPRENESGGKYATGTISQTYTQGQRATFQVDLTAYHKGYFEFKLCPISYPGEKETQECFNKYPVALADGSGYRYYPDSSKMFNIDVVLPANLICSSCVLQWRYHAGNNWGVEPNGTACVGCGYQEEFYGCADITILPRVSRVKIYPDSPDYRDYFGPKWRRNDNVNKLDTEAQDLETETSSDY